MELNFGTQNGLFFMCDTNRFQLISTLSIQYVNELISLSFLTRYLVKRVQI